MIVDTHVHALACDRMAFPRNFQLDMQWAKGDLDAADLRGKLQDAHIDRALLVQAYAAYGNDNRYVLQAVEQLPKTFGAVVMVDPVAPEVASLLSELARQPGVVGVRLVVVAQGRRLDDAAMTPFYEACASLRLPLCMLTTPSRLPELDAPLRQWPELRMVIEHLGLLHTAPAPEPAMAALAALACHENCSLKFSTINVRAAAQWPGEAPALFGSLLRSFGGRRLMWGSDYPSTGDLPIAELLPLARRQLSFVASSEVDSIFGGAACEVWPRLTREGDRQE